MATIGSLIVPMKADSAGFARDMRKGSREVKRFEGNVAGLDRGLAALSGAFAGVGVLALGANLFRAASDAEEVRNKFNVVFRDVAAGARRSAEVLDQSYGLSRRASQQLLADTADLLTGFGFTQQSALELSTEVNKLAVDLASFSNFAGGAKGASEALTKALLGERESVKALGISILETDVKQQVLENSAAGLTHETERQAKAFATLQLAQEQSANAIGDYARSQGSAAQETRDLNAALDDLKVKLGGELLPIVSNFATNLNDLLSILPDREEGLVFKITRDFLIGEDLTGKQLDEQAAAFNKKLAAQLKTEADAASAAAGPVLDPKLEAQIARENQRLMEQVAGEQLAARQAQAQELADFQRRVAAENRALQEQAARDEFVLLQKQAEAEKRRIEELKNAGKRRFEETATAAEKYATAIADIARLEKAGAIDAITSARAQTAAFFELRNARLGDSGISALERGSAAEISARRSAAGDPLAELDKTAQAQLAELVATGGVQREIRDLLKDETTVTIGG